MLHRINSGNDRAAPLDLRKFAEKMISLGGIMSRLSFASGLVAALAVAFSAAVIAASAAPNTPDAKSGDAAPDGKFEPFKAEAVTSTSTVTIGGQVISYQAIAGTLIVHPKDWDDVPRDPKAEKGGPGAAEDGGDAKNPTAEASMFYVAYFKIRRQVRGR